MTEHYNEGKKLADEFRNKRFLGNESVWAKMKKRKLHTFKSSAAKINKKVNNTTITLKEEKTLVTRFLIMSRQREGIDLESIVGHYELSVIPKSLFAADGQELPCSDKSKVSFQLSCEFVFIEQRVWGCKNVY